MSPSTNQWVHVAGWTLVHFLWQGGLIAMAAGAALRFVRPASPQARYSIVCAALAAMLVSPAITARVISISTQAEPPTFQQFVFVGSGLTAIPRTGGIAAPPVGEGLGSADAWLVVNRWLPVIVSTWLAGVALLLIRLAGGWWRVRRLHHASLGAAASGWQVVGDRLALRLRLGRMVHIVDSLLVETPTVVGWLRPVIILPIAAFANLTPAQVDAILAHELAHIRRHDYLVNLLQTMAETLLFYHPAVWWVSARIRAEREHCCDAVAVGVCGDAVGYAAALAELETARVGGPAPRGQTALALAATGGSLLERVRRVLSVQIEDARPARSETMPAIMTAALVLLFVIGAAGLRHQPALQASSASGPANEVLPLLGPHLEPNVFFRSRNSQVRQTVIVRVQRPGAPGQASSTMVSGTISDVTGAAVLGATVVLSDVVTAVDHTAQTNQLGHFEFVGLAPGNYLFGVTASGLEPLHDRLTIFARETMRRDVTVLPQTLSFDITVLGGPPPDRGSNRLTTSRNNLRPLPPGWICSNTALTGAITSREYCGPASEVHELERDTQERLKVSRDKGAQPASMASTSALTYPQDLRDAMIEGSAVFEGRVGTDGSPVGLKSVAPVHPGLAKAALEAVGQWRFEPARLHDVAVESPLKVTINFRLHQ